MSLRRNFVIFPTYRLSLLTKLFFTNFKTLRSLNNNHTQISVKMGCPKKVLEIKEKEGGAFVYGILRFLSSSLLSCLSLYELLKAKGFTADEAQSAPALQKTI